MSPLVIVFCANDDGDLGFEHAGIIVAEKVEMGVHDADEWNSRMDNHIADEDDDAGNDDGDRNDTADYGCTPDQWVGALTLARTSQPF